MATTPQPDPTMAGGAPSPDAGASPAPSPQAPSQGQPSPQQTKLAILYQACKQLAQENPVLATGLSKAAQGIQEASSALVSQPQQQPVGSSPPY